MQKVSARERKNGVTDGTRTRDVQSHNLVLYRLSYGHQFFLRQEIKGAEKK